MGWNTHKHIQCVHNYSVALPRSAMGLSAVCGCGIFLIILAYYFLYRYNFMFSILDIILTLSIASTYELNFVF